MKKLRENEVWYYEDVDVKHIGTGLSTLTEVLCHVYISNYGSKTNFLKNIASIRFISGNWVKERITESVNRMKLELSKLYPDSFIYYTTTKRYPDSIEDITIITIIPK